MPTDVQPIPTRGCLRRMAEPESPAPLGSLPPQTTQGTLAVMVPLDPGHPTGQGHQGATDLLLQGLGHRPGVVHEIPKDEHVPRLQPSAQQRDPLQIRPPTVTGHRHPQGLGVFGLGQVHVGQQQPPTPGQPQGPLGQQLQPLIAPVQRCSGHQSRASRRPASAIMRCTLSSRLSLLSLLFSRSTSSGKARGPGRGGDSSRN